MPRVVRQIKVKNARGERFVVSEVEHLEELADGRARKLVHYSLQTGQPGSFVDANTFKLARTGETLVRVRRVKLSD